jgi:hypothetical protein
MDTKEKFKCAIIDLLNGQFMNQGQALWEVWSNHLHDVNPETLPDKPIEWKGKFPTLTACFQTIKEAVDERFDANMKSTLRSHPQAKYDEVSKMIYDGEWKYWMNPPLSGMGHQTIKRIKVQLFLIYEQL